MSSVIRHVTVDCKDAYAIASFWGKVLDRSLHEDDKPGDPAALLLDPTGKGSAVLFISVPEGKSVKNRVHFDLMPTDRSRDEEVARVIELGATVYEDHRRSDGTGWVTMLDPEGNEFCVERSAAERA